VEHGKAPEAIPARTKADTTILQHELPLCPYPRQARYSGFGQVNDGANWQCADPEGKS
jgi:feruloyl esterase